MPAWDDYKAEAAARGALAFELFVAVSEPAAAPEVIRETLPAHLEYIGGLEAKGSLVLAGPLSDETGREMQAMGMIVVRAENFEDAYALIAGDPMHQTGARTFTLRKWLINEGGFSLTVRLSGQSVALG